MSLGHVIALMPRMLDDESSATTHYDDFLRQGATALVRDAEGQISLQDVRPDKAFLEKATATGCFRRGKPIIDPVSREIMGYEMEIIAMPGALRPRRAIG